jgi:allophanate hydrolase subunit 2
LRGHRKEIRGDPMVAGALQVPPSGRPTLFLADHPVVGGYPVIAVLDSSDVDRSAQARPRMS